MFIGIGFFDIVYPLLLLVIGYFIGQKRSSPLPFYNDSDFTLFSGSAISEIKELIFSYKDEEVKNLTLTIIGFWNEGRETLEKSQINKNNPIKLYLDAFPQSEQEDEAKCRIIQAKVDWQSDEKNNSFRLTRTPENENVYELVFEYVESRQGVIVYVIHTSPFRHSIKLTGGIKGFEIRRKDIDSPPWELRGTLGRIALWIYLIFTMTWAISLLSFIVILFLDSEFATFGGIISSPEPPSWYLTIGSIAASGLILTAVSVFLLKISSWFRRVPLEIKNRMSRSK